MKPLTSSLFTISILSLFLFIGCKDKEEDLPKPEENPQNKIETLLAGETSKSWLLQSVSFNDLDITSFYLLACERDNSYVLYRNGQGELRNGEVSCVEDEPEILKEGSWEVEEETSLLSLDLGNLSRDFTILELNEESLKMELEEEGKTYIFIYKAKI